MERRITPVRSVGGNTLPLADKQPRMPLSTRAADPYSQAHPALPD